MDEKFFKAVYLKCSDVRCESQVLGLRAGLGIAKFASDRWSGGYLCIYRYLAKPDLNFQGCVLEMCKPQM